MLPASLLDRVLCSCTSESYGLVSIIVPVYNCENYLEQCLESILSQTYPDLDVLLVNDGSSDGSGDLCDRYARTDRRVRVFHKTNGGVSSARNLALGHTSGELLMFIDADDHVAPTFVEAMVLAIEGCDVAACAYDRVKPDASQPFVLAPSGRLSLEDLFEHTLCTPLIGGGCCNKIFRTDILRDLTLSFDSRIAVGEDMLLLVRYFQRCKNVGYVGDVLYHYRFNEVSATEAGFAEKKVSQGTASILLAVDEMAKYVSPADEWQKHCVDYRRARSALRLFLQMVLSRTDDMVLKASIQRIMRSSLAAYLASRHTRGLEKVVALALAASTRLTYSIAVAFSGLFGHRLLHYRT